MPYKKSGDVMRPHYDMGTNLHKKMKAGTPQRIAIRDAMIEAMGSLRKMGAPKMTLKGK